MNGASRVIMIDQNWRLDFVKERYPNIDTLDFSNLGKESVTSALKKMCNDRGPDISIECAAGEYAKSWAHKAEIALGLETDTSELVNEMITSTRNFGSCGITGVYVGFVSLTLRIK
jgi:threonine dehydrogenase-like Zn-dependent dehydrogenase